ncbi:MAG: hypothetical protein A2928_02515 [Candidatus Taylorbacteria bacterium RIFCSPLOWO2_01_FULL_45_15b]|uniref:YdbS-like PH domain-containing protein n=1 Tax=Candidatus Taylorbacteria bacterium RIFCSPLOWO2_01_FULL_45_15b TaxID=1802319 RepID=A0A1G2N9R7_9BACT|nr:MAG: hypothetical protein A2928_02515 [Candidatus Taylorbacteria bacterium RIFCSPLOWO2_01_FULL_45_15b]
MTNYEQKVILDPDERIVLDARKHWFVIFVEIVAIATALVAPLFIFIIAAIFVPEIFSKASVGVFHLLYFYAGWFLVCWTAVFAIITDYCLGIVRITNKRIIDIDQQGFFRRNIATLSLRNIQDITIETYGILATLFKFGNLKIQSAGEQNEFVIRGVRDPEAVKAAIIASRSAVEEAPQKVIIESPKV